MVARQLAADVASMEEAPPDKISKYSFYLAALSAGGGPKVVRCVERGWGVAQHKSVIAAAADGLTGGTDVEATAVVSGYGLFGPPEIEVTVFARGYSLKATFPFTPSGHGISYVGSDEQAKDSVLRLLATWHANTGAKPPRKKFLGIF